MSSVSTLNGTSEHGLCCASGTTASGGFWDIVSDPFNTANFPARWKCGTWSDALGWLHISADLGIWLAYSAIPAALLYFCFRRRRDLPFQPIFWLFASFIILCGLTHLVEAVIFWEPVYRFAGLLKMLTAVVSWCTVAALLPIIPKALHLRSPEQLEREVIERTEEARLREIELKAANEELHMARAAADAANRAKGTFLANMSHEIRTPITAILGYTELLADERGIGEVSGEDRQEAISTIRRNGKHLLKLINDILDLSKIEAGHMTIERAPVDPTQIVEDVISLMGVQASKKGISLKGIYETPVPQTFPSDAIRLKQTLVNLIGNAIKFTGTGGVELRVGFVQPADGTSFIQFTVADTGIGMTPEQIDRLFKPFSQGDNTMARRFGGTGLGLVISKQLIEMLGGTITVRSEAGKGTTFVATVAVDSVDHGDLRRADMKQLDASATHPKEAGGTQVKATNKLPTGFRVLLAEDGADNQRLISHYLKQAGAVVTVVENGKCAVESLTMGNDLTSAIRDPSLFDLIIMDMQMPEMDGYEATQMLRRMGCRVPVIALTAHAMSGDREKCLQARCDDYAAKPIDRDELIRLCKLWVGRKHEVRRGALV